MGITQLSFEGKTKVEVALDLIRAYEPRGGYYLGFSGGKDSCVLKHLTELAGVKFDAHYNVSPIDPQGIRDFIKQYHSDVIWDNYARGFFKMIETKALPTRIQRWCCRYIKEPGGIGRVKLLGMRAKESVSRKDYCEVEQPRKYPNTTWVLPLVRWSNQEVWEYIRTYQLPYCPLYDDGFRRLGCVLCPFQGAKQARTDVVRFPKIALAWQRASQRYFQKHLDTRTATFKTWQEYWDWWISRK